MSSFILLTYILHSNNSVTIEVLYGDTNILMQSVANQFLSDHVQYKLLKYMKHYLIYICHHWLHEWKNKMIFEWKWLNTDFLEKFMFSMCECYVHVSSSVNEEWTLYMSVFEVYRDDGLWISEQNKILSSINLTHNYFLWIFNKLNSFFANTRKK